MKITVVTVCYNAARTLERTILSVLSQDVPSLEYIVVDGGSMDETPAILNRYQGRITRIISEKDRGIYDAMNKGWRAASGEFVYFLNADDWLMSPQSLRLFLEAIDRRRSAHPDIGEALWHGRLLFQREDRPSIEMGHPARFENLRFGLRGVHQPATMFPRSAFARLGGFDLNYRIASDFELIRRFARVLPIYYVDQLLVVMPEGGMSSAQARRAFEENMMIARRAGENWWRTSWENRAVLKLWLKEILPGVHRGWRRYQRFMFERRRARGE